MPDTRPTPPANRRPTAVAIKDSGEQPRPQVIAKGHGAVAEQILQLAFAAGVKVRHDADLVEVLEAIEIDSEIPVAALATVAEILSYLYRANASQAAATPPIPDNETL